MNIDKNVEIIETPEYGSALKCNDIELADKFEDFLTECCFVFFNTKLDPETVTFFFGQASSSSKVIELYNRFTNKDGNE